MKFGMRKPSINKCKNKRKGKKSCEKSSNPWLWKERDRMDKRS